MSVSYMRGLTVVCMVVNLLLCHIETNAQAPFPFKQLLTKLKLRDQIFISFESNPINQNKNCILFVVSCKMSLNNVIPVDARSMVDARTACSQL